LQAQLQQQYSPPPETTPALQIKTLFLLDDYYLLVLKVLIPTNGGPVAMPHEGFVHVAASLHSLEVSVDQVKQTIVWCWSLVLFCLLCLTLTHRPTSTPYLPAHSVTVVY
jgi:hypothetical protein